MRNLILGAKYWILQLYGFAYFGVARWSEDDRKSAIDLKQAGELYQQGATFIDVRGPRAWQKGSVRRAVFATGARLDSVDPKPADSDVLVTFCEAGDRARKAARRLKDSGYSNVFFIWPGGYTGWEYSGLPTVQSC